jgi:tetratricopeptide (TPR) repeat protein
MRLTGLICALLVACTAGRARAEEEREERAEGRRRFESGEQYYRRGQYQAALEQYQAGYGLTRLPGFLINIGHCYRLEGQARKARATYRTFLVVEPASPHKAEVEELIRALDRTVAEEDAASPTSAARPAMTVHKLHTPSTRWWLWSALASSVVGSAVANRALADAEK